MKITMKRIYGKQWNISKEEKKAMWSKISRPQLKWKKNIIIHL